MVVWHLKSPNHIFRSSLSPFFGISLICFKDSTALCSPGSENFRWRYNSQRPVVLSVLQFSLKESRINYSDPFQLFIAQYHIWLANDTHGILVLLPGHPLLNFLLTTTVFVLIAQDVRDVTVQLQKILVPKDRKTWLTAIFICFAFTFIPFLKNFFTKF